MKRIESIYLKILITCGCLLVVFMSVFGVSVGLNAKPVSDIQEKIPYESNDAPNFFGILVCFSEADSIYLGFDAAQGKTAVIILPNMEKKETVLGYGYNVDCVSYADFDFLARLIDDFGGIELNTGEEGVFKYTGVQITEMLSKTNDRTFKKTVISKLLTKMNELSVEREDFLMLIEQTNSNLNFPDAYYLNDTVNAATGEIMFVNQ